MIEVVGITFKNDGQVYYFEPNNLKLKIGDGVIVETEKGLQYANVSKPLFKIEKNKIKGKLKPILRLADKRDLDKHYKNIKEAHSALIYAKKIAIKQNLQIRLLDATYTFDRDKLLFRFLSETRVDFRNLAKELATKYRTRIELRQIGSRDKAKEIGGCGQCGRSLCCNKFLKNLDSVSINMAKNQNVSLNPSKINGLCNRLLCCLSYENDNYTEYRKKLPKIGDIVKTKDGTGKVVELNIINQTYKVEIDKVGIIEEILNGSN
ncbi:MAG: stage 0 sporulation protein [Clostridium sp.]|nr:stage 0 sporulation protein [Clostridium sp.]MCM1443782.1 signal peptidase II [Candidatus Amulumruptor caecigallinarius]